RILSSLGVHHAIMVGKVDKAKLMHDPWRIFRNLPDWAAVVSWYKHLRHDKRSHAVLSAVAAQLNKSGVTLLDSTAPIPDEMATIGTMTSKGPGQAQQADIDFAWPLLAHTLRLDIGQAIAVRERDVIAVEAVEGTDRMIERAGKLCRAKGWTLVKGARIGHDRRADVPTVGVNTIRNLHAHGGTCLALAAGDVIMLDKEEMIRLGDRLGVAIVGVDSLHGVTDGQMQDEATTADLSIAALVGAESVAPIVIHSAGLEPAAAELAGTNSSEALPDSPLASPAAIDPITRPAAPAEQSVAS
ncbi:MAG: LpxI family protein, partial [Planctomycetota bacterium]|nr:LpxI family protein [Planctomycetota bacterium]